MPSPTLQLSVDLSRLRGLHDAGPELDRVLRAAAFQAGSHVHAAVVKRTPVDLGTARNDIALDVFGHGEEITARVAGHMAYLPTLEEGRKAGKKPPPYEALMPWVQRNLTVSYKTKTGKTRRRKVKEDELESLAFLVARKIGREGLPAQHMFAEGLRVSAPHVRRIYGDAVEILVRRLNG